VESVGVNTAVNESEPVGSADVWIDAVPLVTGAEPNNVEPEKNCTVPAASDGVNAADNVTAEPAVAEPDGDADNTVDVDTGDADASTCQVGDVEIAPLKDTVVYQLSVTAAPEVKQATPTL
jgi:hypothetical protein